MSYRNPNPGTVTYGRDAGLVENYPNYYEDIEIDYKGVSKRLHLNWNRNIKSVRTCTIIYGYSLNR